MHLRKALSIWGGVLNSQACMYDCLLQTEPSFVCYLLFATIEQCSDGLQG
ncbi:hypothetical protein ACN38_g13105, partial [Penicillium nordicum]